MQVWVDADACPRAVREILIKMANRKKIMVTFISNQRHNIPDSEYIKAVQVAGGFDVADEFIIKQTSENDLIITADVPLAAAVVKKGAYALSPRGRFFNAENIQEALTMRNLKEELRSTGIDTGGQKPFSKKDRERFANRLDQFIRKYWKE
jgi:uncharacterized protein YaiI (UPF0178 family)